MNDIIQNLEANATNGRENFCYISEKQLNAMKELSKRKAKENKQLKDNWNKLKEYLETCISIIKENPIDKRTSFEHSSLSSLGATLSKMQELERSNNQ